MFTEGFVKTAYDEREEYEKANKVDNAISKFPHGEKLKAGDRVVYYNDDRGWKRGPWAHHTKGCSHDEAMDKPRDAYEKALKKKGIKDGFELSREVDKKFPRHHNGDWKKHAVGIGDLGTVVKVDKKGGLPRYDITWDKHPDCIWPGYQAHELKVPPKGM